MVVLAAIAALAPPSIEVRHYRVRGILATNGTGTLTRTYDPEKRTLTFRSVIDWNDKSRQEEIYVYDAAAQPLEVSYSVTGTSNDHAYRLKAEGERFRTFGGVTRPERGELSAKKLSELADPSQYWFVTSEPTEGTKTTSVNHRAPFFQEKLTATYLGKRTIPGSDVKVPVVERSIGSNSPRIRSYLDPQGMPLRTEWSSGGGDAAYRVDEVVQKGPKL